MSRFRSGLLGALASLLLLAACAVTPPPVGNTPTVVSTDPADGSVDVALNASVSITFSEPMNQAATEAAISSVPAFGCTFTWDPSGSTVTCIPGSDLTADTLHTVTVGTGAQDLAANPLQDPFSFSFTTGIDLLATCLFDDASSLFDACVFGN